MKTSRRKIPRWVKFAVFLTVGILSFGIFSFLFLLYIGVKEG